MLILPIIQARSNSTRLPGKVLMPLGSGLNTIDFIIRTLQRCGLNKMVLATTDSQQDDELAQRYRNQIIVHRGSEANVLSRFVNVIQEFKPDYVIRVCADNPFLLVDGVNFLVSQIKSYPNKDYLSFKIWGKPSMMVPLGIFVELIKSSALLKVSEIPTEHDKEHVTISLYDRKESNDVLFDFEKEYFPIPQKLRLTMDTAEDLEVITALMRQVDLTNSLDEIGLKKIIEISEQNNLMDLMQQESSKKHNLKNFNQKEVR